MYTNGTINSIYVETQPNLSIYFIYTMFNEGGTISYK